MTSSSQMGWEAGPWPKKPRPMAISAPMNPVGEGKGGGGYDQFCPLAIHMNIHVALTH